MRISELIAGLAEEVDNLGAALENTAARTGEMQARAAALDRLIVDGVLGPRDLR